MIRSLLAVAALAWLSATPSAQPVPRDILAYADSLIVVVDYHDSARSPSGLRFARVTVLSRRGARLPWRGPLRGLRLYPTREASRMDGVVGLEPLSAARAVGYGFVPERGVLRGVAFAGTHDQTDGWRLPPARSYGGDGNDPEPGEKPSDPAPGEPGQPDKPGEPDTPGGPDDPDDDWEIIDPWDPDREPTPKPDPAPDEWPGLGSDLENPWEVMSSGNRVYIVN